MITEEHKIFDDLKDNPSKSVKSLAKKLYKKCNLNSRISLENICRLANVLFIYENDKYCLAVIDLLKEITFEGNYDKWTWVEYSLALKSRLTDGREEYVRLVNSVLEYGTENNVRTNKKAFKRVMNGELLDYDEIKEAVEEKDKKREWELRSIQLLELIQIKELGGSDLFPEARAEKEIQENLEALKKMSL